MSKIILCFCAVLCIQLGCNVSQPEGAIALDQQPVLSPNACTAASLTAPSGGFISQVGAPIALSASATCPAGQQPEFQYWGRRVNDTAYTILTRTTGGAPAFVPGASSFTPGSADVVTGDPNYCFRVAVRNVGSTDAYQALSDSRCGIVVAGAATSTRLMPASAWHPIAGSPTSIHGYQVVLEPSVPDEIVTTIPMNTGEQLQHFTVYYARGANVTAGSYTFTIYDVLVASGALMNTTSATVSTGTGSSSTDVLGGVPLQAVDGHAYIASVMTSGFQGGSPVFFGATAAF